MAIIIDKDKKKSEKGTLSDTNYKDNNGGVPATQGNVINTLNAYNEQLKKQYYDKEEAIATDNALQTSIMNLVKELDANTKFTNKTKSATTSKQSMETDTLDSVSSFDADNSEELDGSKKTYSLTGLIKRVEIIANLISGNKKTKEWTYDSIGNVVGVDENRFVADTPIVGMTRKDGDGYSSSLTTNNDGSRSLNISGLSSVSVEKEQEDGTKSTTTTDISEKVVLSEKQVSDMIKSAVLTTLGTYDNQISALLGFLLFTENELSDAYQYILKNTNNTHIHNAPLYVTFETDGDLGARLKIHDLNGTLSFGSDTEEYYINSSNQKTVTTTGITNCATKEDTYWKIKADESFTTLSVYYSDDEYKVSQYTIPIPQITLSADFGKALDTKVFIASQTLFTNDQVTNKEPTKKYSTDGKVSVNVPIGSKVTLNVPDGVKVTHNNLFNTIDESNKVACNDNLTESQKLYCGHYTVGVNTIGENVVSKGCYETESVEIEITSVSSNGKSLVDKTNLGKDITIPDGQPTTSNSEDGIKVLEYKNLKINYTNVISDVEDALVWEDANLTVTIFNLDNKDTDNKAGTEDKSETYSSYVYGDTFDVSPSLDGYDFVAWADTDNKIVYDVSYMFQDVNNSKSYNFNNVTYISEEDLKKLGNPQTNKTVVTKEIFMYGFTEAVAVDVDGFITPTVENKQVLGENVEDGDGGYPYNIQLKYDRKTISYNLKAGKGSNNVSAVWDESTSDIISVSGLFESSVDKSSILGEGNVEKLSLTGYTFDNWKDENNNSYNNANLPSTFGPVDNTFTAQWKPINYKLTFTVTKNPNDSSITITNPTEVNATYGETVALNKISYTPIENTEVTFSDWSITSDSDSSLSFNVPQEGNLKLISEILGSTLTNGKTCKEPVEIKLNCTATITSTKTTTDTSANSEDSEGNA